MQMKNLTIAFLAAMSIASFGCKKKNDAMAKMGEYKDKMCGCKDKACADKVNDEYTKTMTEMAKDTSAKPSEDDMKKGAEMAKDYADCMSKAMGGGDMKGDMKGDEKKGDEKKDDMKKDDEKKDMAGDAGDLPKECQDYIKAMDDLAKCDKMPAASRDAMKQGLDAMKSSWNFKDLPADAKKTAMEAAATACKSGADALAQGAKAAGC